MVASPTTTTKKLVWEKDREREEGKEREEEGKEREGGRKGKEGRKEGVLGYFKCRRKPLNRTLS